MYEELRGNLMAQATHFSIHDETSLLLLKAADAIEELAAFREQITDGYFYCMKDGILYAAKVEMPKGKTFQLPPIEFAEPPEREGA